MGKYLTLFFLFLTISFVLKAQENDGLNELKSAYLNVQNENYKEAYPYFKKMLGQYPKEPTYNYYFGRCLLFLEHNPEKAINYLRFASTKDVPVDVYYYLGIAYTKNYKFEKAIESFQRFEKNASKKELKNLNYDAYLAMAQNGLYLTKYIRKPLVYSKQKFDINDFYKIYSFVDLEGSFIEQSNFLTDSDSVQTNSIMFVPNVIKNNDFLYITKINDKRGDYDIYRITKLNDSTWSEPENLGDIINTPFDEGYPFMHSDGTTLYFASKGHYSIGGYDLYKSTWDWNTQQWSEPENLDFPINSPYDDILFVPSPNKKIAFFGSDRDTESNNIMVYKLKLTSSEPYIELDNYQDILTYAKLDVNVKLDEEVKQSGNKYKTEEKELVKIKDDEGFLHKSEYDSLLNLAINYQLKADSLRWVIDEKRSIFDNTSNGQERARLSNIIIELEREIYDLQKKADGCYNRVREIEQMNLASTKAIYENDKKNEPKKYTEENREPKIFVEPTIDSLSKTKLTIPDEEVVEDNLVEFGLRIENPSVYNKENPIPLNETLPDGVIYMIQLGAFSSEKSTGVFKGLTPLSCIKSVNSNIRKYFAGKFLQLSEAEEALPIVKSKGFKDAYIVAFDHGDIISVKKAVTIESKDKSVYVVKTKNTENIEKDDKNENLSIIFILKGQIEQTDSVVVENIKTELPENLELFIEPKQEKITFLVKSFSSYDGALPIKKKLEAILGKEVEIHAYFAENQIPLEQARKITK